MEKTKEEQAWERLISAAEKSRECFMKVANELRKYEKTDASVPDVGWDKEVSFCAKTCMTEQFRREIGARLINNNPRVRVAVKKPPLGELDDMTMTRAGITEWLLNHAITETDFFYEAQRVRDCGLTDGRGVAWIGLDSKKKVSKVVWDTVDNLLTDPDGITWDTINWVARIRHLPRWEVLRKLENRSMLARGAKAAVISASAWKKPSETGTSGKEDELVPDMLEIIEVWMLEPIHAYVNDIEPEKQEVSKQVEITGPDGQPMMETQTTKEEISGPVKYVLLRDSSSGIHKLYSIPGWETPFHVESGRQAWPCEVFDPYPSMDSLWPISPLNPGLPWAKLCNWAASLLGVKMRRASTNFIAILEHNGIRLDDDSIAKIGLPRSVTEFLRLTSSTTNGDGTMPRIQDYLQYISETTDFNKISQLYQFFRTMFAEETGLNLFLYSGNPDVQDRSAQATTVRDRNTTSRIQQYQANFDEFLSRSFRKAALCMRHHLSPEDVMAMTGSEQSAEAWGLITTPEELARAMQETDYGVEVGSVRRKTPEEKADMAQTLINSAFAPAMQAGLMQTASLMLASAMENGLGVEPQDLQVIRQEISQKVQQQQMMMNQQQMMAQQQAMAQAQQGQPSPPPPATEIPIQ